jgi:hypothetical protein
MIYLFDLDTSTIYYYFILSIGSCLLIYILIYEFNNYKENIINKYLVTIKYNSHEYKLEGFIDTGNRLKSIFNNKDIILVDLDIKYKEVIYVPYKALNTNGIIPCIKVDKITINNKDIDNCLVGLARDKFSLNGVNCILPNRLKERLL